MKIKILLAIIGMLVVPMFSGAANSVENVIGTTCLVPVFHTDFAFPPEGGKIVRIGNQMYFVINSPECANAGSNGTLIKSVSGGVVTIAPNSATPAPVSTCTTCNCAPF